MTARKPKAAPARKAATPKKGRDPGRKTAPPTPPPAKPAAKFSTPPKPRKPAQLTPRQARFVEEYLLDLNGTQAATRAGYSPKTANEQAARLLANVSIAQAVQDAMAARSKATGITAERILAELGKIAFSDARRLMKWTGATLTLLNSDEITDDAAATVAEVKQTTTLGGGSMAIKVHDKVKALELAGKHVGMFVDRTELTGAKGKPLMPTGVASGVLLVPGVMSAEDWLRMSADPAPDA